MYKRELDNKLNKKEKIKGILLYGADPFLIGHYGNKIAESCGECEKYRYYFGDYNFEDAISNFSQGSLFGDVALVWIKVDKKIAKKQLDSLVQGVLNSDGFLIVEFYQAENRLDGEYSNDCKAMESSFSSAKGGIFPARFFRIAGNEAKSILREYANKLKIQISDNLLMQVLEGQNNDLGLSVAELQKYSIFPQEITPNLVADISFGLGSVEVEEILETTLNKGDFLKKLERFLEQGVEEVPLINKIQKYFYQLFLFYADIKENGGANLSSVLGYKLPLDLEKNRAKQAMRLNALQYEEIFFILNAWREDSMKGINKGNRFLSTLIKIQAILR